MVVVECYCYYINIIVEPPDLVPSRRRPFSLRKMNISDPCMAEMVLTLQQNDDLPKSGELLLWISSKDIPTFSEVLFTSPAIA